MKNQAKQLLILSCFIASILITSFSYGQKTDNNLAVTGKEINLKECEFVKFTVKQYENKAYITWLVINRENESLFVVEHSNDGKLFKSIALKEGAISPNGLPLMFSFVHEDINAGENFYRIKFFGETNQLIISNVVKVKTPLNLTSSNL